MKWLDVPPGRVRALGRAVTLGAVLLLVLDALLFGGDTLRAACLAVAPRLDAASLAP